MILGLTWRADSQGLVSSDLDGVVRRWSSKGEDLGALGPFPAPIRVASMDASGEWIAIPCADGATRLVRWDGASGPTLGGHQGEVLVARRSPDGRSLLSGGEDGTARLYATTGGAPITALRVAEDGPVDAAFMPDGRLVTGSIHDRRVRTWDRDGRLLTTLAGHTAAVSAVRAAPQGDGLVSLSFDKTARLWSAAGEPGPVLAGHYGRVTDVAFAPDGASLVTVDDGGGAWLWNTRGQLLTSLLGHVGWVTRIRWSPDGQRLLTSGQDGSLRIWALDEVTRARLEGRRSAEEDSAIRQGIGPATASGRVLTERGVDDALVQRALPAVDGHVLTWAAAGAPRLWGPDGQPAGALRGDEGRVLAVAISADGRTAITGGEDGSARIWGLPGGEPLRQHRIEGAAIEAVATPSPEGHAAFGNGRGQVWIETAEDRIVAADPALGGGVRALAWLEEGSLVGSGGGAPTELPMGEGAALLVVSPDRAAILVADDGGAASIFDSTGELLAQLEGHGGAVTDARFLPEGAGVVTASIDGVARVFGLDGRLRTELAAEPQVLGAIDVSPDGRFVATGSAAGSVRLWGIDGGSLGRLVAHQRPVLALRFDPEGRRVLSCTDPGAVQVSWVHTEELLTEAEARLAATPIVGVQRGAVGQYGNLR